MATTTRRRGSNFLAGRVTGRVTATAHVCLQMISRKAAITNRCFREGSGALLEQGLMYIMLLGRHRQQQNRMGSVRQCLVFNVLPITIKSGLHGSCSHASKRRA